MSSLDAIVDERPATASHSNSHTPLSSVGPTEAVPMYEDSDSAESDGDPPDVAQAIAMREASMRAGLPHRPPAPVPAIAPKPISISFSLTQPPNAKAHPPKTKFSRRRYFEPLEQDAWDTPEHFYNETTQIARDLPGTGMELIVGDDRTQKTSNPYLHLVCAYKKSGCPFILKLLNRPKEGGWVLRSQYVEGTNRVDPRHGSIYHCVHVPGGERDPPDRGQFVSKRTRFEAGDDLRPVKRPRPSVPIPSQVSNFGGGMPRSESAPAISAQAGSSTYRMPNYGAPQVVVDSQPWQRKEVKGALQPLQPRPHPQSNVADRILAPPFARGQGSQGHAYPAGTEGTKSGMAIGTAYAGHSQSPMAEVSTRSSTLRAAAQNPIHQQRRAPPVPPQHPHIASTAAQNQVTYVPPGYLAPAPAPSHHAAYFAAFRAPSYPIPIPQPRFPAVSPTILPQWQYFFAKLDKSLIPLADIMAREEVNLSLAHFYKQNELLRRALVEELQKHGANLTQRTTFAVKMEDAGRKLWERMKQLALERMPDQAQAQQIRDRQGQVQRARAERDQRKQREAEAEPVSVHQSSVSDADDDENAVVGGIAPPPAQEDLEMIASEAAPVLPIASGAVAPGESDDGDVSMADEQESAPVPVKEKSPSPVIDWGPEPPITWVTTAAEMTKILTDNGAEYLSIFRKQFVKNRAPNADLTGRDLQMFFKDFKWQGFYMDVLAWHITFESSQETERAWRARNKKRLAGQPVGLDLCAQAGKLGSLQSPPSARGRKAETSEPMAPRRSLGASVPAPAPGPVKEKKRRRRSSKSRAIEEQPAAERPREGDDALETVREEGAPAQRPAAVAVTASAATSDSETDSLGSTLIPRPRSTSLSQQQSQPTNRVSTLSPVAGSKASAQPASPRAVGPFSLQANGAQPKQPSPVAYALLGPTRKKSVNTPQLIDSDSEDEPDLQPKPNASSAPGPVAPAPAPAAIARPTSSSSIPGLGHLNTSTKRPAADVVISSDDEPLSKSVASTPGPRQTYEKRDSADSTRQLLQSATQQPIAPKPAATASPKRNGMPDFKPALSMDPSTVHPAPLPPFGLSRKEALFAHKSGMSFVDKKR